MNEKEVAEIRRRFRSDRASFSRIRGCYVNTNKEVVSEFNESLGLMSQTETDELMAVLKKTLSGTIGKNLIDIEFATQQVVNSDEHNLLMALRDSGLENDEAVREFYGRVIQNVSVGENYLILLVCDKYDVPTSSKAGDGEIFDASETVFSYILCSVCPVKLTKAALGFHAHESKFKSIAPDWAVSAPEFGFMFPSFDDRAANIYNALYYSKNTQENHKDFVDAVFNAEIPMPPAAQKETFCSIIQDAVGEDCSIDVVQSVHEQISGIIEEHKLSKETEPLVMTKREFTDVLESSGVPNERVQVFEQEYDEKFGEDAQISPKNVIDPKQMELKLPDVSIKVNPERCDLVQTRVIDGTKYIMIRANEGVEVNGVAINITE